MDREAKLKAHSHLSFDDGLTAAGASGGFSAGFSSLGVLTGADSQATAAGAGVVGTGAGTGAAAGVGAEAGVGAALVKLTVAVEFDCWVAAAAALGYWRTIEFRHSTKLLNQCFLKSIHWLSSVKTTCAWHCCLNKYNVKIFQNINYSAPYCV